MWVVTNNRTATWTKLADRLWTGPRRNLFGSFRKEHAATLLIRTQCKYQQPNANIALQRPIRHNALTKQRWSSVKG